MGRIKEIVVVGDGGFVGGEGFDVGGIDWYVVIIMVVWWSWCWC